VDDLQTWYRQGLSAFVDALEIAKDELKEKNQRRHAIGTFQRVAQSLRSSGESYGFPEISSNAAEFSAALSMAAQTDDYSMIERSLMKLTNTLEAVVSGEDPGQMVNILIVDDDVILANLLKARLEAANRKVIVVSTGKEADRILLEEKISLILLDLTLPDVDGRTLLARLRVDPLTSTVPVIILSVPGGNRPKAECFALGADIYFEKPFKLDELSAAVAAKLHRNAEMTHDARKDALTGLPNRAAFSELFLRVRLMTDRGKEPLSVGIIDLDHFKLVNDNYGHKTGDDVLKITADIISTTLRKSDYFARWGGEEFVALFPQTDDQGAVFALNKSLKAMNEYKFVAEDGRKFHVSFSAGVVEVDSGLSVDEAIAKADRFLYLAKEQGRNRILTSTDKAVSLTKKILLADDDKYTATVVKRHLNGEGFEVLHCKDGVEALSASNENPISLFILDVKMPKMNGFELLALLREKPSFQKTPVIVLTAVGEDSQIVRGFELGADDYMLKPFSPVELVARIRRLLKKY